MEEGKNNIFESYFSAVRTYLDVIDDIRKLGIQADIELPSIVVIGDQSSGKSSILEAVSGLHLPKGNGVVTRCPLIIECRSNKAKTQYLSYMKDSKRETEVIADKSLEEAIKTTQCYLVGNSYSISSQEITLHIESPNNPDLTLIDLPGIARCSVMNNDGNQSEDIHKQTKNLIHKYITNKLAIILCVIQADVDLAASEVLTLAKKVDPNYERTMGVLTRPDKVSASGRSDLCKIVKNEKYPLGLGYHVVRCRTLDELQEDTSLEDVETEAKKLFNDDPHYSGLSEKNRGIASLKINLSTHLFDLIKKTLPTLRKKIDRELVERREALKTLPLKIPDDEKEIYLFKLRHEFLNTIQKLLTSGEPDICFEKERKKSYFSEWREKFETFLEHMLFITNTSFRKEYDCVKVKELINNQRGRHVPGFHNYALFESLIKAHIKSYHTPAKDCMKAISLSSTQLIRNEVKKTFGNFEYLEEYIEKLVDKCRIIQEENCNQQMLFLFEMENQIFTQDKTFNQTLEQDANTSTSPTFNASEDAQNFSKLMKCYLSVVNQRLGDSIPSCIRVCLQKKFYELIKDELSKSSTDDPENPIPLVNLLVEKEDLLQLRRDLKTQIEQLETAIISLK